MPNNYSFDGSEGGLISKQTADTYRENYQQGPCYTWNQGIKAHFFGRDIINELLAEPGAVGIRIYYGSKVNAQNILVPELVIYAVDSAGENLEAKIADISKPCPPYCPD